MTNKAFSDWYDSLPYGEPSYQETFEAGAAHAREMALSEAAKVAAATVCDTHIPTGVKIYGSRAGKAIEALKGK